MLNAGPSHKSVLPPQPCHLGHVGLSWLVHDGLNKPMVQLGGSRTRLELEKCGLIYAAAY